MRIMSLFRFCNKRNVKTAKQKEDKKTSVFEIPCSIFVIQYTVKLIRYFKVTLMRLSDVFGAGKMLLPLHRLAKVCKPLRFFRLRGNLLLDIK